MEFINIINLTICESLIYFKTILCEVSVLQTGRLCYKLYCYTCVNVIMETPTYMSLSWAVNQVSCGLTGSGGVDSQQLSLAAFKHPETDLQHF